MIFQGSRYEFNSVVIKVTDAFGIIRPTIYVTPGTGIDNMVFKLLQVSDGDRLESIADAEYGDPNLWYLIADANPELFYPDDLEVGAVLRIPLA